MSIFKKINKNNNQKSVANQIAYSKIKKSVLARVKEYSFEKWRKANPTKSLIDFFASSNDKK